MTGKVAPHENRELKLIAAGRKNFAVIEKRKNAADYFAAGAIETPGITVAYRDGADGPEVIVSRKRALVAEYDGLILDGIERLGLKNFHRAMGRLFGYSAADIEAFIAAEIDCNCAKCGGPK